jgi:hypothetical protein
MAKTITTNVVVNAPVEHVWDVLTDLGQHQAWNPFIVAGSGTIKTGQRLVLKIQPPGGGAMTFTPTVTVVEHHQRFEWLGHLGLPGLLDGRHSFTFTPMPGGRSHLQQEETFSGVLVPFLGTMLDRTRNGFVAMNDALAHQVTGTSKQKGL